MRPSFLRNGNEKSCPFLAFWFWKRNFPNFGVLSSSGAASFPTQLGGRWPVQHLWRKLQDSSNALVLYNSKATEVKVSPLSFRGWGRKNSSSFLPSFSYPAAKELPQMQRSWFLLALRRFSPSLRQSVRHLLRRAAGGALVFFLCASGLDGAPVPLSLGIFDLELLKSRSWEANPTYSQRQRLGWLSGRWEPLKQAKRTLVHRGLPSCISFHPASSHSSSPSSTQPRGSWT